MALLKWFVRRLCDHPVVRFRAGGVNNGGISPQVHKHLIRYKYREKSYKDVRKKNAEVILNLYFLCQNKEWDFMIFPNFWLLSLHML